VNDIGKIFRWNRLTIYAIITLAILFPLVRPIGIPIPIGESARTFYELVDNMKPGDIIWVDSAFSLSAAVECVPQLEAISQHALKKGAKVIMLAMSPDGQPFAERALAALIEQGAVYGEDIVYLGFVPGEEPAIAAMMSDLHRAVPRDYRGTPLTDIPITKNVRTGNDIAIVVPVTSNATAPDFWTRQIAPYPNTVLTMASQASLWPRIQPYLPTGQIAAALNGARGAAEYELMIGKPSIAVASMDATSIAYLTFVLFIIVGNLAHWLAPDKKVAAKKDGDKS